MRKSLLLILVVAIAVFLTSCFEPIPAPDREHGVVKLLIRNPNFGFSTAAIPVETDSFVVLIKGLDSDTPMVFTDSFGNKEYIEFSIKLPGGRTYGFYLMGRSNWAITCFDSVKNVVIPAGEATQLNIQMKVIDYSCTLDNSSAETYSFKEPKYSMDEPRIVNWSRNYYFFTFTGEGLGTFFHEGQTSGYPYVYTGYEFNTWQGKRYYLSYFSAWYPSTGTIYDIGSRLEKVDNNTIRARIPIYFPLTFKSDNSPYQYDWGKFTFYVPALWGGELATFRKELPFSELTGDIQIIVE